MAVTWSAGQWVLGGLGCLEDAGGCAQPGALGRIADRLVAARAVADFACGFCAASSLRYTLIVN